ncbi:MAG: ankyrin repeat domain-containing protein [Gemmatimonadaceae bacterium]|nr:ankyrin repeat domain-containing protein [Gemmatimonadaceae bacterium]
MVPSVRPRATRLATCLAAALLAAVPALAPAQEAPPDTARLRFRWVPGSVAQLDYHKRRIRGTGESVDTVVSAWNARLEVLRDGSKVRLGVRTLGREGDTLLVADTVGSPAAGLVVDPRSGESSVVGMGPIARRIGPELLANVQGRAPSGSELAEALDRLGGDDVLGGGLRAVFGNAVAFWWGAALEVGSEYQTPSRREIPILPGTTIPTTLYFGVQERVACREGMADTSCVRLIIVEETQPDSLNALLKRFLAMSGITPEQAILSDIAMERRFTTVLEPWSLLPYGYEEHEAFGFAVSAAGEGRIRFLQARDDWMTLDWTRARPALHVAAIGGDMAAVRAALAAEAEVDEVDADGLTALYHAASHGHDEAVRRLVQAKADPRRAETLARTRGDVRAVQVLRRVARVPARPAARADADSILRTRWIAGAIPLLVDEAALEAVPGPAHARLAEWLASDGRMADAVALASRVVAVRPCEEAALRALREAHDPYNAEWDGASDSASAAAAARLVRCAPQRGDTWYALAWRAARRGDAAAAADEAAALDSLAAHPLLAPGQLALARWMLEAAGPRDVLIANGPIDFVSLRLQQRRGIRPEVAVVEWASLNRPSYARAMRDRVGLPLPYADAKLEALDRADGALTTALVTHWAGKVRDGSLGRGLVAAYSVDLTDHEGPGRFVADGVHFVLADTAAAAQPSPGTALAHLRAGLATVRGPMTVADDPMISRQGYDVTRDVLSAGLAYLNSVSLDVLGLDAAGAAAADTLVTVLDSAGATLEWRGRDEFRRGLAASRMELRGIATRAGDRSAMRRHAAAAARLAPGEDSPRLSLANSALLARDWAGALPFAGEAVERRRTFDGLLVTATALRLAARPDSALAVLAALREMLERVDDEARADFTMRRLLHLPTGAADTTGALRIYEMRSYAEAAALVAYLRGITEAVRGDLAAADAAVGWGRSQSVAEGLRCYVRNQLLATQDAVALPAAAQPWFASQVAQFPCRAP